MRFKSRFVVVVLFNLGNVDDKLRERWSNTFILFPDFPNSVAQYWSIKGVGIKREKYFFLRMVKFAAHVENAREGSTVR